jgi:hypothetical protein
MSSTQESSPTIAGGSDYALALVSRKTRGLKSTMIGRAWMSIYLFSALFCVIMNHAFSPYFWPIITFEFRNVLRVFLVGIYALLWRILVAYLTQSRACTS